MGLILKATMGLHKNAADKVMSQSGGGDFSPDDISNLRLWLDAGHADMTALYGDDDKVDTWIDESGNSYNFQAPGGVGAADNPIFKTDIVNSLPIIRFDGSDDILKLSSLIKDQDGNDPWAGIVFAVVNLATLDDTYHTILGSADEGSDNAWWLVGARDEDSSGYDDIRGWIYVYSSGITTLDHNGSTGLSAGSWYILIFESDDSNCFMWVDGASETIDADQDADNGDWISSVSNRDNFTVGGLQPATETYYFKGDIAEIIMYGTNLGEADRNRVKNYLATKYDITVS